MYESNEAGKELLNWFLPQFSAREKSRFDLRIPKRPGDKLINLTSDDYFKFVMPFAKCQKPGLANCKLFVHSLSPDYCKNIISAVLSINPTIPDGNSVPYNAFDVRLPAILNIVNKHDVIFDLVNYAIPTARYHISVLSVF